MPEPPIPTPYTLRVTDLARRYCAESGLSAETALHITTSLVGGRSEDISRLPEEEREACRQSYREGDALGRWVWDVWQQHSPVELAKGRGDAHLGYPAPDFLPLSEQRAILAHIEQAAKEDKGKGSLRSMWDGVPEISPACAAHFLTFAGFRRRVLVQGEELRAYLARVAQEETGRPDWIPPDRWIEQLEDSGTKLQDLEAGCFAISREEVDALRRRAEEAERQARDDRALLERERQRTKDLRAGLADRIVFPGQLVSSGYGLSVFTSALQDVQQGELFPSDDITEPLLRAGAEAVVEQSQLATLTPAQIRAIVAVYRLFTSQDDDGKELLGTPLLIPASVAYRAAGLKSTRDKSRRAIFEGFRAASEHMIYVALKGEDDEGKPYVTGERVPLFGMRPVWSASADKRRHLTNADADHLARAWARLTPEEPWKEQLPNGYVFTLPPIMRKIWRRLVLGGDTLDRLEKGAKKIRGGSEGFTRLDWRVFIAITQTVQHKQRTADNQRFKSYLDPIAILEDVYGADKIAHARRRGKLSTTYLDQYHKALAVMEAGDIAITIERDYRTTDGELRDVIAINPEVMVAHEGRIERQTTRRITNGTPKGRARPKGTRRRRGDAE